MSEFILAFKRTIKNEGGYSNNPKDKGGETFKGISRKYNPYWSGWEIIDSYKKQDLPKIDFNSELNADLDLNKKVKDFYEINIWDKNNLFLIKDQLISEFIYDFIVNSGGAIKVIQKAVDVKADGILGAKTAAAINSLDASELIKKLVTARVEYLKSLKGYSIFGNGWVSRAESYLSIV